MLNASTFEPGQMPFFNLLTGVMLDQPVTLANTLSVGGDQTRGTAPLRVYGSPGHVDNLLELYPSRAEPIGFGLAADGRLNWSGDTFLGRGIGAGVVVAPLLEVQGDLVVRGRIQGELGEQLEHALGRYVHEVRRGTLGIQRGLIVGDVDPWQARLGHAQAALVVRADDLSAQTSNSSAASLVCWSGNWLQCNIRFWDDDPSRGWQSKRLTLDFDADTLRGGSGGRISMQAGKVGIGRIADVEGAILALQDKVG